jgi:hypothetical protein
LEFRLQPVLLTEPAEAGTPTWLVEGATMSRAGRYSAGLTVLAPLVVLLCGCGPGKGDVEGEVTFNGKPIPWGRVTFLGQDGKRPAVSARIINGRYKIKGCQAGPVKISVESFRAQKVDLSKFGKMGKRVEENDPESIPPPEVAGKYLEIPKLYADIEKSGLEYTVQSGSQTHDIPLTP